jgi:hypothetical protein
MLDDSPIAEFPESADVTLAIRRAIGAAARSRFAYEVHSSKRCYCRPAPQIPGRRRACDIAFFRSQLENGNCRPI